MSNSSYFYPCLKSRNIDRKVDPIQYNIFQFPAGQERADCVALALVVFHCYGRSVYYYYFVVANHSTPQTT
jgi:hypothetical protein